METVTNVNISNLTEFISEALASTTSSLFGAAASAAATAAGIGDLPSSSSSASVAAAAAASAAAAATTSSSTSGEEAAQSLFEVSTQRIPNFLLLHPLKLFIKGTRRMAAHIDVPTAFALIGLVFVICLYLIHMTALLYSKYRLHRKVEPNPHLPGVSVIKPIVGFDKNLKENLESFFTSQYHKFELLFCFHSKNEPAVELVNELIKKYPNVESRIFFEGEIVGSNPKINNMMPAYRTAKYPLVLISDSGIFMKSDAILDMATTMMSHEKMALVTQAPYCKDRVGFDAAFEQVYFGTSHGRIYLAGNCLEFVCSTGMSSMMKKEALDKCGGIAAFSEYLAEDYFFGRELANRGFKSAISTHPALQNSDLPSIWTFLDRICRWVKLRIAMLPHIILVEPLQDCFPAGLIISLSLKYLFNINPMITFITHLIYWFSMDFTLMHSIQNGELCFPTWQFIIIWLMREMSGSIVFLVAMCKPTIQWKNNVFHLAWGGRIRSK